VSLSFMIRNNVSLFSQAFQTPQHKRSHFQFHLKSPNLLGQSCARVSKSKFSISCYKQKQEFLIYFSMHN